MIKTFTKLGIFDRIIILATICILIFIAFLLFRKSTYLNVTVKVNEDDINYVQWAIKDKGSRSWFSNLFYTGMKEISGFGVVNAEVTNVKVINISPAKDALYLKVKLKTVYTRAQNQYSYKGSPVLIGYPIKMYLDNVFVEAMVVGIDGIKDPRTNIKLNLKAKIIDTNQKFLETTGVEKFVADSIKVGDKVLDSDNNVILEIRSKNVENAKKIVTTSDGRIIVQKIPNLYDVELDLLVNAVIINNNYYIFDDFPILIGEKIPINTPNYSIVPMVTNINKL